MTDYSAERFTPQETQGKLVPKQEDYCHNLILANCFSFWLCLFYIYSFFTFVKEKYFALGDKIEHKNCWQKLRLGSTVSFLLNEVHSAWKYKNIQIPVWISWLRHQQGKETALQGYLIQCTQNSVEACCFFLFWQFYCEVITIFAHCWKLLCGLGALQQNRLFLQHHLLICTLSTSMNFKRGVLPPRFHALKSHTENTAKQVYPQWNWEQWNNFQAVLGHLVSSVVPLTIWSSDTGLWQTQMELQFLLFV